MGLPEWILNIVMGFLSNPTKVYDFIPELDMGSYQLETVEEMKLLGLTVRSDLSWSSNTEEITKKGYGRLRMGERLKKRGASPVDYKDIYCKQVRVWGSGLNSALTKE